MILEDGRDDHTGLYEIIWSLNTKYPDVARGAKVTAAREVVLDLLRDREIALFTNRWASSSFVPVPLEREEEFASADQAFDDPTDAECLWYATVCQNLTSVE